MVVKNSKNNEIDSYQGYSQDVLLQKDLNEYVWRESIYGLYFHFEGITDWGKVLDFGGRIGEKTRLIKNVTVLEIDKTSLAFMKKHNIKCISSLSKVPDESFDTIYVSHVLEHLERPVDYLRKLYKKLKKGGNLIIAVPCEFPIFEPKKSMIYSNGHLHTYNFRHLMTTLDRAGFKIKRWKYHPPLLRSIISPIIRFFPFKQSIYRLYMNFRFKLHNYRIFRFINFYLFFFLYPFISILTDKFYPEIVMFAEK